MQKLAFVEVLRISSFRNLWLAQAISQICLNLLFFSLMIRVYDLTHSNTSVALLVLLLTIPNIFLGALAGVFVDRWGRKPVMFFSHFLRFFAVLAFLLSPETVGWIYTLAFLISVISQFFFPAEAGTIPQLVKDPAKLLSANSLFSVTFFAAVVAGNCLAGPALRLFGPSGTFLLVGLAFLIASFFTARLPGNGVLPLPRIGSGGQYLFSDFLAGLDHIYKNSNVRRGIFLLGASQVMISVLGAIAPGFAGEVLKMETADVSLWIMAPAAAGVGAGAFAVGQFGRRFGRWQLIRGGVLSAAVVLFLYALVDCLPVGGGAVLAVGAGLLFLLGGANAFLDVPANTLIQEETPASIRSRVYGVISTAVGLASLLPVVLAGGIADAFGVRAVMFLGGGTVLAMGFWLGVWGREKNGRD